MTFRSTELTLSNSKLKLKLLSNLGSQSNDHTQHMLLCKNIVNRSDCFRINYQLTSSTETGTICLYIIHSPIQYYIDIWNTELRWRTDQTMLSSRHLSFYVMLPPHKVVLMISLFIKNCMGTKPCCMYKLSQNYHRTKHISDKSWRCNTCYRKENVPTTPYSVVYPTGIDTTASLCIFSVCCLNCDLFLFCKSFLGCILGKTDVL